MTYHDHHLHPFGYAALVNGLELMDAPDLKTLLRWVARHGDKVEGAIVGQRLNDEGLKELRLPTASDIDDVISDRPVLLYRYCGHIAVANSAALALAGIDADTPDPEGGIIDRDPSGRPTGVLRETAVGPVTKALEPHARPPSDQEIIEALAGLRQLGLGSITGMISVTDAVWCAVDDEVGTLIRLAPDLAIDIDVLLISRDPEQFLTAKERIDHADGPVRFHGWKDFSDGSLGGHTAAMYEPFADRSDTRGKVLHDHERAMLMGKLSAAHGGVVAIHAIGDRANDLVLDTMAELIQEGVEPERLRIEHASILTAPTIVRMAHLGVTASVQPAFLVSEETWLEKRLGADRMRLAYPFRSLIEAGVTVLGGSDSPVEWPDPQVGMAAAVTRHGINPDEAVTRDQAEAMFSRQGYPDAPHA